MAYSVESVLQHELPSTNRATRKLIHSFIGQRAAMELPELEFEPFDWLSNYSIYYLPDEAETIYPSEWEIKEHETYTLKQAREVWRERGCESSNCLLAHCATCMTSRYE